MAHFIMNLIGGDPFSDGMGGLWMFLSVGAVALFVVFIPLVTWIDNRRKEREAFYKAESLRRLSESSGDAAKAAIQFMREQERIKRIKMLEGINIGGLVNLAVGIGIMIFLRSIVGNGATSPLALWAHSRPGGRGIAGIRLVPGRPSGPGLNLQGGPPHP